ncbi:hypothetical protein WJX79_002719 [Trebouxia sp. C0005]
MQRYKKAVKLIWPSHQVTQGVTALHSCGRSHTDLKPGNIQGYNWDDPSSLQVTVLDLGSSVVQAQCHTYSMLGLAANKLYWPAAST